MLFGLGDEDYTNRSMPDLDLINGGISEDAIMFGNNSHLLMNGGNLFNDDTEKLSCNSRNSFVGA